MLFVKNAFFEKDCCVLFISTHFRGFFSGSLKKRRHKAVLKKEYVFENSCFRQPENLMAGDCHAVLGVATNATHSRNSVFVSDKSLTNTVGSQWRIRKRYSQFIPKSCSVGSPCCIIYTICGFAALPVFGLN